MSENNDFGSFFAGFVIGGLIGAAVALMLAPQSGEETRTIIRDKSIELKDRAVETGQDVQARAEAAIEDVREAATRSIEDLRERIEDLSQVTKEKTTELKSPGEELPEAPGASEAAA